MQKMLHFSAIIHLPPDLFRQKANFMMFLTFKEVSQSFVMNGMRSWDVIFVVTMCLPQILGSYNSLADET